MSRVLRKLFVSLVFAISFVVNPAYFSGCAAEASEPSFGEAELLELLDAANDMGRWEIESDGKRYEVELVLIQAMGEDTMAVAPAGSLFAAPALACGSRSFLQAAHACETYSELGLEGTLTIRDLDARPAVTVVEDLEITGTMGVWGEDLRSAFIELAHGSMYGAVQLDSPDARTFEIEVIDLEGVGPAADFTLLYDARAD